MSNEDITSDFIKIKNIITSSNKRLDWNEYFMALAYLTSIRSPCERLQVGCVLVNNKRVISAGYNGFLPNAPHKSMVVNEHEQATVHAEQNAIADAASRGVKVNKSTAYITHFPCINCAKILAAAGIKQIKYYEDYKNDSLVNTILLQAGISIIKILQKN